MLQRLKIALAQVIHGNTGNTCNTGNTDTTSGIVLNEIRQIIYSCFDQKKLLKKCIII